MSKLPYYYGDPIVGSWRCMDCKYGTFPIPARDAKIPMHPTCKFVLGSGNGELITLECPVCGGVMEYDEYE